MKNFAKYDEIVIGYQNWWNKEPMIIRTFLESYNLKGKKIVPFCTSGGNENDSAGKSASQFLLFSVLFSILVAVLVLIGNKGMFGLPFTAALERPVRLCICQLLPTSLT